MADTYSRKLLKVVVAQLSQAIGWHSIQSTPLELMTDILSRYLEELGKLMHRYAEQFGHTDPNLDDVGLAFRDMGINMHELEEYIRNVDCVACSFEIPKFPVPKDSHLNFLKPGSREVVTRPVHVHEHLPPMHPEMEEEDYSSKQTPLSVDITPTTPGSSSPLSSPKCNVFKRPGDPVSVENPALKRARLVLEEEGRPLREISSVMMTLSGFLSPAREGKLPESRTPLQPSDSRSNSPQPSSYPMVPPEVKGEKKYKKGPLKRTPDGVKKLDKENKKKEHKAKGTLQPDRSNLSDDTRVKKLVSMKELSKLKILKSGALKMMAHGSMSGPSTSAKPKPTSKAPSMKALQATSPKNVKASNQAKTTSAAVAAAAAATAATAASASTSASPVTAVAPVTANAAPIVATGSTPVAISNIAPSRAPPLVAEKLKDNNVVEGKLLAEPDKQKLNIFKKISKVKEDKGEKVERLEYMDAPPRDSRESSPGLVIDESEVNSRQREARIEAQIDDCIDAVIQKSMEIAETPSKPKTPSGPPLVVEDSAKVQYHPADSSSHQVDTTCDVYMFDDDLFPPGTPSTPKTPELPASVIKGEKNSEPREPKEKKKKKDKSKSKKELKGKAKGSSSPKKLKGDASTVSEWPKTPEGPEPSESASAPVFPFFPHFQPAPGLIPPPIPHTLFPRFPLPIGKNVPHPAMPNLPMPPPLFMRPCLEDSSDGKEKSAEKSPEKLPALSLSGSAPGIKLEKEKEKEKDKEKDKTTIAASALPEKKSSEKKPKEHKKEKKDKDKAKKKKERKEKLKNKEKEEKKKIKAEKKEKDKEKIKEKKEKKEKKKDKEREEKSEGGVPKITFKLGPASSRPPTPDATLRKIVIKPVLKKQMQGPDEECEKGVATSSADVSQKRDPSPELARISALITRPPRQKASSKTSFLKQESPADGFPTSSQPSLPPCTSVVCTPTLPAAPSSSPNSSLSNTGSAPSPAASTGAGTGAGSGPVSSKVKKALKPISKPKAKDVAKKSGADAEPHKEPIAFYYDNEGKKVWFCPACGGQDDGSPMIGCDDCDAWYHWVCVGIQVPPDENEDWYCRVCIVKKQENIVDKKKKSRKRKIQT